MAKAHPSDSERIRGAIRRAKAAGKLLGLGGRALASRQDVRDFRPTILIVDDDPEVLAITAQVLAVANYRVLTASGGEVALEILRRALPIDLMLADVVMPVVNGFQLAARAKLVDPELRIVFTSGYWDKMPSLSKSLLAGRKLLRKPWRAAEFTHEIGQIISMDLR